MGPPSASSSIAFSPMPAFQRGASMTSGTLCATLLLVQGVSPGVVMEVLGHSQIGLTMNSYAHVIPELRREAADRMDQLLDR